MPQTIKIRIQFHECDGAVRPFCQTIKMIPRVHTDAARGVAICIQNPTRALHRFSIQCGIINVETINAYLLHEVIQSFEIKIVPTRIRRSNHSEVELFFVIWKFQVFSPSRHNVIADVLDQPWVRTAAIGHRPCHALTAR